ncbi:MAG TPA: SMP-30/gluconolactonase/LRE family protein [Candidatus Bathyarchaeia archaeon]|nr:SMP-30/gluconolactonase/LRE family protein [Candidatus Bathyarchaeia archaeon]
MMTAILVVLVTAVGAEDLIAPGAVVEKLAGDFAFTEGPACDSAGNVFFTDQPNDRILEWDVDGNLTTWMQTSGRSNGLCFDKQGFLWACADEKNELWRIGPDKKVTVVVAGKFEGKLLNAPNDVWVAPNGSAYFTDPFYKRDYWIRGPAEQPCQGVYYVAPDGKLARVVDHLKTPNGIIGTPDGKTLYVTDLGDKKTYSYSINQDGTLANKKLLCEMGSDGMTIDDRGNVYLTSKGVFVFDKAGKQIAHIDVDEPWTANVCFGGKDMQTLFITASKGLYAIRMQVKGVGSQ